MDLGLAASSAASNFLLAAAPSATDSAGPVSAALSTLAVAQSAALLSLLPLDTFSLAAPSAQILLLLYAAALSYVPLAESLSLAAPLSVYSQYSLLALAAYSSQYSLLFSALLDSAVSSALALASLYALSALPSFSSAYSSLALASSSLDPASSLAPQLSSSAEASSLPWLWASLTATTSYASSLDLGASSTTPAPLGSYYSTVSVGHDTTITTLVAIPTSAAASDLSSTTTERNGKIIGGVVGAVGGAVLIGGLAVLLYLKKRNAKVTNQLPDFVDTASTSLPAPGGFRKLFGARSSSRLMLGFAADPEKGQPFPPATYGTDGNDDDFEYRGVSNYNNLDPVFRSGANLAPSPREHTWDGSQTGTGAATPFSHSRYNSVALRMEPVSEAYGPGAVEIVAEAPYPDEDVTPSVTDDSSYMSHGDESLLDPHLARVFRNEHHSNASRLRFTEDLA